MERIAPPLDRERLSELLPQGVNAHVFDSLDSTNLQLRRLADSGAGERTLVISAAQTSGRGRQGRDFYSPPGTGVYFSLLLRCEPREHTAALVTAAAALAVAQSCETVFGTAARIKWVNDVLVRDKKVSGILAESYFTNGFFIVLGIGVNISPPPGGFPDELSGAGAILTSSPPPMARERFAAETVSGVLRHTASGELSAFADLYRARCDTAGKNVTVTRANERFNALALGVDDQLRLIIKREDGIIENISFGEVSLHNENR